MIAVFTDTQSQFLEVKFHPKKNFKRILNVWDLKGEKFTGVIKFPNWESNKKRAEAYQMLTQRQPEIFK